MKIFTFSTYILLFIFTAGCQFLYNDSFIAVNQVGYNIDEPKEALLVNSDADQFEILETVDNSVVYVGDVKSVTPPDSSAGDCTSVIDFTDFTRTGEYIIRIQGNRSVQSEPFSIGQNLYSKTTLAAVQSYYYNRCGTEVNNGTNWKHTVCHTEDAAFYSDTSEKRDVTGGWHDAGDYGKFSINTGLSLGLLLYLYESNTEFFKDGQLNIPEKENGVPDLLDETKWALVWLLKMQKEDGAVYHKVSQKKWVGEYLPQEDSEDRYIYRSSSNATAGFAAVAALGARLYQSVDQQFSGRLAEAAQNAWKYLENNPEIQPSGGFKNPSDVKGGEYSDINDKDVRLWAAVELYKMTGNEKKYLDFFVENYRELLVTELPPLSWKKFHSLTLSTFLNTSLPGEYKKHHEIILDKLKTEGNVLIKKYGENNYRTLLDPDEYYWGSASVNLGYAYLLIQLHRHTGAAKYYKTALDQLHYTLGRNPFNQTFLTGIGSRPVQSPYHQFSMESDVQDPVPGMMVGGPNNHLHLREKKISKFPGKNYQDNENNYLVNEVAINFTAIFAYVAGYFTSDNQEKNTFEAG